jgi:hypothetical protein
MENSLGNQLEMNEFAGEERPVRILESGVPFDFRRRRYLRKGPAKKTALEVVQALQSGREPAGKDAH